MTWNLPRLTLALSVAIALAGCSGSATHDSKYSDLARTVTTTIQNRDLASLREVVDPDTNAKRLNQGVVDKIAAAFAPLGELKSVSEANVAEGSLEHRFDLQFAHGQLSETLTLDDQGKVFKFHYDSLQVSKN